MEDSTNSTETAPKAPQFKPDTEHEVPLRAPNIGICIRMQNAWLDAAEGGVIPSEHNLSLKAAFVAACFPPAPSERTCAWERIARDLPNYYEFKNAQQYGDAALEVFVKHRVSFASLFDLGSFALEMMSKRIPTLPQLEDMAAPFVGLRAAGPAT